MKTSFSRIFTAVAVLLLAALLAIGFSFQYLVRNFLEHQTVDGLENDGQIISQLVQAYAADGPVSQKDFHFALTVATSVSGADAVICDASGKLILCAEHPFGCPHTGLVLDSAYLERTFANDGCRDVGTVEGIYAERRYVVSVPIRSAQGEKLGIVILSTPTDHVQGVMDRISEIFLFVSLLSVFIAVIIMTIFTRRQTAPLRQMAKVASAFEHGDFSARVDMDRRYAVEIQELALSFNNMAASLEKSENQRQEFVANVSHELKTPMTSISGYVDGILDGTIPPERSRQYLQLVSDETKRLSRLVRSMLDISQLQEQGGVPETMKSRFDLAECAGQVLISFEQKIELKQLQVEVQLPDHPVYTSANHDSIIQVLYNLVDNAVKFCPEGSTLGLGIQESDRKLYVHVFNDGQTIPPEELPLVFDRFHKTDKSRSQDRDSWGLGLYIVKTIIGFHGENISVTSREGRTTFTFTLPTVNEL